MSEEKTKIKTLGQIAYEDNPVIHTVDVPWEDLDQDDRDGYETSALAVVAYWSAWIAEPAPEFPDDCTCLELEDGLRSPDPACPAHYEAPALRALLGKATSLLWDTGLTGNRQAAGELRASGGLEALT